MRNKNLSKRDRRSASKIVSKENSSSLQEFGKGNIQELVYKFSRRGQLKRIAIDEIDTVEMIELTIRYIQTLTPKERIDLCMSMDSSMRHQAAKVINAVD